MISRSRFLLWEGSKRGALRLSVDHTVDWRGIFLGMRPSEEVLECRYDSGKVAYDLIFSTLPPLLVLSGQVVSLLEREGVTGCAFYSVKFIGQRVEHLNGLGYRGLSVIGRCGELDMSACKKVISPPAGVGGAPSAVRLGYCYREETWDGAEVFCPKGTTALVVTQRARDILKEGNLANVEFVCLDDVVGI